MILIKNDNQIKNIIISSKILADIKKILYDAIKPGISGLELDNLAEKEMLKRKVQPSFKGYQGFQHSICISFNEEIIHGIPSTRKIQDGDLIKIDIGCIYKNMHSDSAFTKVVGKKISAQDLLLIKAAKESFYAGVNAIKKGARIGDISAAISKVVKKYNLYVPENFSGHGIGTSLHEDPYILNEGIAGTGPLLKDNMTICIEPMLLQSSNRVKILKNGWTVVSLENKNTSHYEHTVLIQNGKPKILTEGI